MDKKLYKLMNWPLIEEIVYSESSDPHRILGVKKAGSQSLVQAFFPGAKEAYLYWVQREKDRESGKMTDYAYDAKMELADEVGFFAALVPAKKIDSYYFMVIYGHCSLVLILPFAEVLDDTLHVLAVKYFLIKLCTFF